ncbi:MAG TPA: ATP-binding protein [Bryobacteraceae bacterium]|nr:ATP-binding protein [Bryobacteraceae bacterium]
MRRMYLLWHNPVWDRMVVEREWWRQAARWVRPQDLLWLLLFSGMAMLCPLPYRDILLFVPLTTLAALQILEPKLAFVGTRRGKVIWIVLKLLFCYVVIGFTGSLSSSYYWLLLLPVISAGTSLGLLGTQIFVVLSGGTYLSFLAFLDPQKYYLDLPEKLELALRVIFLAVAGTLANTLAEALRRQFAMTKAVADQLADANRNLQQAEEAVRRSDRLAALGQLAAGLAHELRNPLGTIRASAEMLNRSVASENEVAREVAGFISDEVDRTNSLVTRFLDFVRPLELRPAPADLAQVLDRSVTMLEREAAARSVTVYKNYSPDIRPFPFDGELMERVFYNLLANAAQATAPGGAITVKTRPMAGNAEISVIDRGAGIDPKLKDSIFNPFFTTKPDGVGLGLAICSKIVDQHGGKIEVESELGKGSVFRVYLPMEVNSSASIPNA